MNNSLSEALKPCSMCGGEGGHEKALSSTHFKWVSCPGCALDPKDSVEEMQTPDSAA